MEGQLQSSPWFTFSFGCFFVCVFSRSLIMQHTLCTAARCIWKDNACMSNLEYAVRSTVCLTDCLTECMCLVLSKNLLFACVVLSFGFVYVRVFAAHCAPFPRSQNAPPHHITTHYTTSHHTTPHCAAWLE